jgi:hypothetical protein
MTKTLRTVLLLAIVGSTPSALSGQATPDDSSTTGPLYNELARMDSILFDAAFVTCDMGKIDTLLAQDIEFVHDQNGFRSGEQVRASFRGLTGDCPAGKGVTRQLVEGSLRVYPIHDYGAIQTGSHRFVRPGAPTVTIARFVHLWELKPSGWKLTRALSFDHRDVASAPAPIDWSADDSARIAYLTTQGRAYRAPGIVLWAPVDSLEARWLGAFADSLSQGIAGLKALIGAHPWQRIENREIQFYLAPDRFVSHASGMGAVFLSLNSVRQKYSPFLHEAAHELLAPAAPFAPYEYPDTLVGDSVAARFPFWLFEGFPDYLAQRVAESTGFREGDVFEIGGLAKSDSTCAARLAASSRKHEILERVGGSGRLEALFTTERREVAPTFYACSQAFTNYLVGRIGVERTVALFPAIKRDTWRDQLESAAGEPLEVIRRKWLAGIGVTQ